MTTKVLLIALAGLAERDLSRLVLPMDSAKASLQPISPATVCPTLTSLVTGVYPERHGVVSDAPCSVGIVSPLPHRLKSATRAKTIFSLAHAAGLKTVAVNWPLTEGDLDIDFLLSDCNDDSDAVAKVAAILTDAAPDFAALQLRGVLDAKLQYGADSPEAAAALETMQAQLAVLLPLAENVLLVGAVSPQAITQKVSLNAEFVRRDLISLDENGCFADYKAWCQSNGLSSFVYLKNPSNMGVHDQTEDLLDALQKNGSFGIGEVLTREDAALKHHLYGSFSFVVCSDGETAFDNEVTASAKNLAEKASCGAVGGGEGFLLAAGPAFLSAHTAEKTIPDVAATCASLLGLKLPLAKGRPIAEILKS